MEPLLCLEDVDALLGVRAGRAAELARQGLLPVVRLGRQVRVDPAQLRRWIDEGGQDLPGGWRREPHPESQKSA